MNSTINENDSQIQFLTEDQHTYLSNINKVMHKTTGDIIDDNQDATVLNFNYYDIDEFCEAKINSCVVCNARKRMSNIVCIYRRIK